MAERGIGGRERKRVVSGALARENGSHLLALTCVGSREKALGTAAESYAEGDSPSPAGVNRAAAREIALVRALARERKRRAR